MVSAYSPSRSPARTNSFDSPSPSPSPKVLLPPHKQQETLVSPGAPVYASASPVSVPGRSPTSHVGDTPVVVVRAPSVESSTVPAAGAPSTPRRVGKRMVCQAGQQGGGVPPPEGPRRRIGVRKAHVLPGDYPTRSWETTAGAIGRHAAAEMPHLTQRAHPEPYDARYRRWERSQGPGEEAGWVPPGGWMRPAAQTVPPDAGIFFDAGDEEGHVGAPERYARKVSDILHPDDPPVARRTAGRARVALPADIPPRPPGCGTGAPSPARHAWKAEETLPLTAIVHPSRPSMLPKYIPQPSPSPPPSANAYVIFGNDPFTQYNHGVGGGTG